MTVERQPPEYPKVRDAITAYIERYGADVNLGDLRSYLWGECGLICSPAMAVTMLKRRGYVREGIRYIDTCPGKATFYVPGDVERGFGAARGRGHG